MSLFYKYAKSSESKLSKKDSSLFDVLIGVILMLASFVFQDFLFQESLVQIQEKQEKIKKLFEKNDPYIVDPFRIWYSLDQQELDRKWLLYDVNKNDVADFIEDLALQLKAAQFLFHDIFGFSDPMNLERYDIKYIDVFVAHEKRLSDFIEHPVSGFAYFRVFSSIKDSEKFQTLRMYIEPNSTYSSTPVHEYFHLIQFASLPTIEYSPGITKIPHYDWLTEGSAEWSEDMFKDHKNKYKKISTDRILDSLYDKSLTEIWFHGDGKLYDAAVSQIFRPLIALCGEREKTKIPDKIRSQFRFVDDSYILEDAEIFGAYAMKRLFACMRDNKPQVEKVQRSHYEHMAKLCIRALIDECTNESSQ